MDPLSDFLALLKPRAYMSGGFDMGGAWSIHFPQHEGIKCFAVVSGECWLLVEGAAEPLLMRSGDCFLLPSGRPFRLAEDIALAPSDVYTLFPLPMNGAIGKCNGGGGCVIVGGYFILSGKHTGILLEALPPIVHIRKESDRAALRWYLEQMMQELREPQPGGSLIAQQLAYMMLVQALRLHLAEGAKGAIGWLFALADRELSVPIASMHENPAHSWTLQELAERAGMSRSAFALKFKETVGTSPIEYLARWRMLLAADKLANSRDPVAEIAFSLGYESESAFSTAFKRLMGCSPRQYSRGLNAVQSTVPAARGADAQVHQDERAAG